jgi:PAS domain S-box-containing protein
MPALAFFFEGSAAGVTTNAITGSLLLIALLALRRTDRARTREMRAMIASRNRFRALIDNTSDGITLIDAQGSVSYRSPAAERLMGLAPGEGLAVPSLHRVHADDRPTVHAAFETVRADPGTAVTIQFRLLHATGVWRWVEATLNNRLDDAALHSIVVNYRDIAEGRRAETALRESEQRFRQMAEHIKEAFFIIDVSTRTPLYVSPTWSEIWERPIEEGYDANTWLEALHADDQEPMRDALARNAAGEVTDRVFRVLRRTGSMRWVRARAFPVRNEEGAVYRVVGVAKDITELRQAEDRFVEAQKLEAVARLAGGVAHDFNNLLTVILAEGEMIRGSLARESEEGKLMEELLSAARSAVTLTRQLLAFSRRQLVEPRVFSVSDAVDNTSKLLRRIIGEDVRLQTTIAGDAGYIRMDPGHFEQVLTNLAVNARDAMPDGGVLTVAAERVTLDSSFARANADVEPGPYILLTVADSGCGMSPDTQARLFEPFFTTKERGKGTGLGLATCHGIVKQAGGHIAVESAPGCGTMMRVYLPAVAGAAAAAGAPTGVPPRGTETILLVEDDEAVRRVGTRMLRAQGYTVAAAADAREAMRTLLSGEPPSLLLTDVVLPGIGGRELADRVRAVVPDIKTLFMTGYTDDVTLRHRLIAHDAVILHKPFSSLSLSTKVREVLDASTSSN